jgi:DNA (cytosine-5)-methyltransferase 1
MGGMCDIRLAVDFKQSAIDVYRQNFRVDESVAKHADITALFDGDIGQPASRNLRSLVAGVGAVDVLVAGPPCQGHSDLNNHSRRHDPRNQLYLSAIRAAEVLSPTFIIIENVPSVVHDRTGVISRAGSCLTSLGYRVAQIVVEFSGFGLPQHRRRHVTLASRHLSCKELAELAIPRMFSAPTVHDFIGDLEEEADTLHEAFSTSTRLSVQNVERIRWLFENKAYDLPDALRPPCHRDREHSYRSMYGRMHWDRPAQTVTTGFGSMGQGRYVHPSRRRMITCHEAARLQGFPDFFRFDACSSVSALREMIGNAVPPQFAASVVMSAFGS